MAQLREGSIIKKATGDEVIATINDIPEIPAPPTKTSQLINDSGFLNTLPEHNHDEKYYTESEIDTLLSSKAELTTLSAHTGDSIIHVTSTDKSNWNNKQNALGYTPLNSNLKGANGGLAELDSIGKVPSSQLPSYVDDVLEYVTLANFPSTGESGKIYVATGTNITYRWSGTNYVEISPSIALGETSSTAFRGDRGKIAYDHSQSTHARADATKVENSTTNGNIKINGVEANVYTHPSGTNPHGTTKSDVGLGDVDNTSDINKPISTAMQTALSGKSDTGHSHSKSDITDFPTSLPASGGDADTSRHLIGDDTRNVNSNPSEYMSGGSRFVARAGWQTEFKKTDTIGVTGLLSGMYCYLQTHTPWSDHTGGYPIQTAYGNGIPCWRVGTSLTTWSDWKRMSDGGNADTVDGFTVAKSVPANADFSNTTYSVISTSEIDAGVSTTSRAISGARVKHMLDKTKPVVSKVKPTNGSPIWFEEI